ncbi:unnamed protein product, partial [Ceratitis capitata]
MPMARGKCNLLPSYASPSSSSSPPHTPSSRHKQCTDGCNHQKKRLINSQLSAQRGSATTSVAGLLHAVFSISLVKTHAPSAAI